MKAKKLLAALGALLMAFPGVAYASDATSVTSQIVEGHTVFAALEQDSRTYFAAVAGIARQTTTIGGVLWFNDQDLLNDTLASEVAAGAFVIATQAGDDDPEEHRETASYAESYLFVDPNERAWIVDRYTYDVCYVPAAGEEQIVPCDLTAANTGVDVDENGQNDVSTGSVDLDGDGEADVVAADNIVKLTKSMFVVEIGDTTTDAAASCGTATGKQYNFVLLVRLDALGNIVDDGQAHGAAVTDPATAGNSHISSALSPPDHTHDTAQIDLWFKEQRPPAPASRTPMFPQDTIGGGAECNA